MSRTDRYWTELSFDKDLSDEEYLELLSDIKRKNSDIIIAPYFKNQFSNKIGVCNNFCVMLLSKGDVALLEQIAAENNCIIILQDEYSPLIFTLSVTEASEFNALECANLFYESGLVTAANPSFVAYGVSIGDV